MEQKKSYPSEEKIWLKRSKNGAVKMPDSKLNVYEYLYECNKNDLDSIALEYDPLEDYPSTKITFRQLFKMIDDCAKSFKELGVKQGEIVTVCLPSFVENIVIYYALNKIGAIPNQIHPLASKDEVKFYLEEVNSKIFVGYDGNLENFGEVVRELDIPHVIMVSPTNAVSSAIKLKILRDSIKNEYQEKKSLKSVLDVVNKLTKKEEYSDSRYISYDDFIKKGKQYKDVVEVVRSSDGKVPTSITHTSGTTGKSKGVVSSMFGFNEMVRQIAIDTPQLKRGEKELLVLPPYPVYVLCNQVHMCLCRGFDVIVIPKVDYKNIHKYYAKHDVTIMQAIPSIIEAMANDPGFEKENIDLSKLKFVVSGGGALPKEKTKEVMDFLKRHGCQVPITIGYGLSEMGSCATCTFNDEEKVQTIGRPLNDTTVMVVDPDTLEELDYEEEGEMLINGPSMMLGYYKNDEANRKIFVNIPNKDGELVTWIRTGDIGKFCKSGDLQYVARKKRITMIVDLNSNTVSKISNDYVEDLIVGKYNSGSVSDCVVISVPSESRLNKLKAYVVIKDNEEIQPVIDEVEKKCEKTLREMARPIEYVVLSDEIPYTPAGKPNFIAVEQFEKAPLESEIKLKVKMRIKSKGNNS